MKAPAGRTAVVTGASGGIGYEIARCLAARGFGLALVARSQDLLDRIAEEFATDFGVAIRAVPMDLTEPDAPDRLYEELGGDESDVEILVNNAGFGTFGAFASTDLGAELGELQLNVVTPTHLTKLFVRGMVRRGSGRIMNVASTAAFQPGPGMAVYFATKAYLLSLTDAIGEELLGTGVTVTTLCPGPTRTGFQARADMGESPLGQQSRMMDSTTVGRIGVEGMLAGKRLVIPGLSNRIGANLPRLFPRRAVTAITARIVRRDV